MGKMKISSKVQLAALGVLALGGVAQAAIPPNTPGTGNGDLMLYVYDVTQNTTYSADLGIGVNSFLTQTQAAGAGATAGTVFTLPGSSLSIAADTTLSGYLTTHSSDVIQWGLMAGAVTQSGLNANVGSQIYLTSSAADVPATYTAATGPTNANLNSSYAGLQGTMSTNSASYVANGVNSNSGGTTFAAPGTSGINWGTDTQSTWYNAGHITNAVGTTTSTGIGAVSSFYAVANSSATSSGKAFVFNLGTVSLSAAGLLTITGNSAVPLPAAVWLFGSGLLGFFGIGRRRTLAAA
jgi:hypothetical protein